MRLLAFIIALFSLSCFGQSIQRQRWTTNTAPDSVVIAGVNTTVTTNVLAGGRVTFTIDSAGGPGGSQTNLALVVAGTNAYVSSVTNLGVTTFTVDGPALRTQWSVGDITNAGTASYSNAAAFLLKAGDTATGPLLSSSASIATPASTELATAGWVRSLFNAGAFFYTTTNVFLNATNVGSDQLVYEFSTNIPLPAVRSWTTAAGNFLTNNGYIGSVLVTNPLQQLSGQISVSAYLGFTGGSSTPTLTLHPEIYYSYDRTNWLGDYSAGNQNIVHNSTNLYQWVIDFPAHSSTNATGFFIQRRFKVGAVTGTGTRTLWVMIGTNAISGVSDASHISLNLPTGISSVPARTIGITVDGGGAALTSGTKGFIEVPYAGTIKAGTLLADQNGSIQVETWRTNAGNLTLLARAGALGSNWLTSTNWSKDYSLTGWSSTSIASNDILGFIVTTNAASCTRVTYQLQVQP